MLLENQHAVIYGAGGPDGAAVARAFAAEGASVSLAGRTRATLDELAKDIGAAGAGVAQVDALDEQGVERHADRLAEQAGGIDICFNAVGDEALLGTPLTELSLADLIRPVTGLVTAQFLIARAVARHMTRRKSGVIFTMTGPGVPTADNGAGQSGSYESSISTYSAVRRMSRSAVTSDHRCPSPISWSTRRAAPARVGMPIRSRHPARLRLAAA
jgi:NADP-dependent 3-hydroxy acid dehydrogenase YdfG